MLAALTCSSMDRLDVVDYFKAMKKEGRLQVLLQTSVLRAFVSLCVRVSVRGDPTCYLDTSSMLEKSKIRGHRLGTIPSIKNPVHGSVSCRALGSSLPSPSSIFNGFSTDFQPIFNGFCFPR